MNSSNELDKEDTKLNKIESKDLLNNLKSKYIL